MIAEVPKPITVVSDDTTTSEIEEYSKIAHSVGMNIKDGFILKAKVFNWLRSRGRSHYDLEQVQDYLDKLFKAKVRKDHGWFASIGLEKQEVWRWVPLRQIDSDSKLHFDRKHWSPELYNKPIPIPVLKTIQELDREIPGLLFFVSDYIYDNRYNRLASIWEDPFLAVVANKMHLTVIERWDEPTFREK